MTAALHRLCDLGQSPWYDNLTRELAAGGLDALVASGIRGVTSNPTIFEKALAAGAAYDDQLRDLEAEGRSVEECYWELVVTDIRAAAERLAPLAEVTAGVDGRVSIEVSPDLAHDTAGTVAQARELVARIDRRNVMIKVPATREGLPAIETCVADGIDVNVTLVFSLARYDDVIEAYLRGLERRVERGDPVDRSTSVASFFVSRVDTETDRRLPERHRLRGRAAVANARLAYRLFQQRFSGERWDALAGRGARVQRPLWASTSTKDPAYSPTLYVDTLVGPHTVNTLAPASIEALSELDPGALRPDTVLADLDGAEAVLHDLDEAGVDFDDVTSTLERDGVAAFAASFHDALEALSEKLDGLS